ncbi:GNAT family N-acetyltransferase [Streptomyces sp. NA04227]|uniref:GNAT family N-acetyltransferase n=1 Tax=Streptomyces sp. NA04227 TaxID=2742136 RepID=UPI0015927432|nr:GNAT family N-acetyltransferase [Streptomyces sp. NA04227]QKW07689.1 GNAT family N-acetyltransferase [Streptomyces sp. NA04227]
MASDPLGTADVTDTPTHQASPELRTGRLLLEPYEPADEDDFRALFGRAEVVRWMGDGQYADEEIRAIFGRIFSKVYAGGLFDVWAVRRGGVYVGHAEIKPSEVVEQGYEIVYALAPSAWGQGLGTELASALTAYGFDALGLAEVHATVAAPNSASLALLTRVGYRHVRDVAEEDGQVTRLLSCLRPA